MLGPIAARQSRCRKASCVIRLKEMVMATFILLHGSFHAAWNWHRLIPFLEDAGHRAIAVDLPGHGRDRTPAHQVTLASCVERVTRIIDALDEPPVLLAHSRNGIVLSQ